MAIITDGDLVGLIAVCVYTASAIALTGILAHRMRNPRKCFHVLMGGIVFFWWTFDTREVMVTLAAIAFLVLLLMEIPGSPVGRLKRIPLVTKAFEGHPHGPVMYAASWTIIAYALFDHLLAASIAIAAMSFGDGMGGMVGRKYGRIEYFRHRTLEGTLSVLVTVASIVFVLAWLYCDVLAMDQARPDNRLLFALAIAAFVSCLEAVTPGRVDNLVIPLVTGGYLSVLGV